MHSEVLSTQNEVVISGISGRFPESDSVEEFWTNLMNGVDMTTIDDRRWPIGILGVPPKQGKMRNIDKLDSDFFKLTDEDAMYADIQMRLLYEVTYEAIWDAGINPADLRGSLTGAMIGMCYDDTNKGLVPEALKLPGFLRKTICDISFAFDFRGPALSIDTACAASFSCLHEATLLVKSGRVDNMLVGGAACHLAPQAAKCFSDMKMVSPDGTSKCLDADANGYCRSEAVAAVFLQRRCKAKRIYATISLTKTNCDGFKAEGITFPSYKAQKALLRETIEAAKINTDDVDYIEAHVTGTAAGDPTECNAIMDAYRVNSSVPLKVGCLKSNIGHSEGGSTVCAITKVALIFQNRCIPPNLHYRSPNPNITGLVKGILVPVTSPTEYHGKMIPINAFGFGGVNVHGLFTANPKVVDQKSFQVVNEIQRLVVFCNRSSEGISHIINWIKSNRAKITQGLLALMSDTSKISIKDGFHGRGYVVLDETSVVKQGNRKTEEPRQLWYLFSALGCQWKSMGAQIMKFKPMADSLKSSAAIVKKLGINLEHLLSLEDERLDTHIVDAIIAIVTVQLALVDLLTYLNIRPAGIIGHSIGEVVGAYADGALSAEQAILVAYHMASCSKKAQQGKGLMAATDLSWEEAQKRCPENVYPACHNSKDGVTISGEMDTVRKFCDQLRSEGRFARDVNCCDIGFHCPLVNGAYDPLKKILDKVIPTPKLRSPKWISSSQLKGAGNGMCDAQYFCFNTVSPVFFKEAMERIPQNSAVVEIGPHALLLPLIKRTFGPAVTCIPMMKRAVDNKSTNMENILASIGEIYTTGLEPSIEKLYPKFEYPVERETSSLSQLIKWNHTKTWLVPKYPEYYTNFKVRKDVVIDLTDSNCKFLSDHIVDGRNLFPAMGYLQIVWTRYMLENDLNEKETIIEFKHVNLRRATMIPKVGKITFDIEICQSTGLFKILESGSVCVTGYISVTNEPITEITTKTSTSAVKLNTKEIYKELRVRGYDYGKNFQGLSEAMSDGSSGLLNWTGKWVSFADSMVHLSLFAIEERDLCVPTYMEVVRCDPAVLNEHVKTSKTSHVFFDKYTNVSQTTGILIKGLDASAIQRRVDKQQPVLAAMSFLPYNGLLVPSQDDSIRIERLRTLYQKLFIKLSKKQYDINVDELKDINQDPIVEKLTSACESKSSVQDFLESLTPNDRRSFTRTTSSKFLLESAIFLVVENVTNAGKIVEYAENEYSLKEEILDVLDVAIFKNEYKTINPVNQAKQAIADQMAGTDLLVYLDPTGVLVTDGSHLELVTVERIQNLLSTAYSQLRVGGFVLIYFREEISDFENLILNCLNHNIDLPKNRCELYKSIAKANNFKIVSHTHDENSTNVLLFRKVDKEVTIKENLEENHLLIETKFGSYEWIERVKKAVQEKEHKRVWLYDSSDVNGLIGLTKCLRKEPDGGIVRCLIAPSKEIPVEVIQNDLAVNVLKNNRFGRYNHEVVSKIATKVEAEDACVFFKTKGDLSSVAWEECSHKLWRTLPKAAKIPGYFGIKLYYSALNFKDVMVASARISSKAYPNHNNIGNSCGMEYSGIDEFGRRVCGMVAGEALATTLVDDKEQLNFLVPDDWTLEEAATVPVVYLTTYYALFLRGKLQRGESVLIHAGSGGVGQAAIHLCLLHGCKVFTTVSTTEKKVFLMKTFPELKENNFADSRSLTFEEHILKETNGRGVDIILNSLAEEKMRASIRCLASLGRFLEIGKYDLIQNNEFEADNFSNDKSYHVICLAHLAHEAYVLNCPRAREVCSQLKALVNQGMRNGHVRPLPATVFEASEVEQAFRFMGHGKHIGKVLIKIRDESMKPDQIYTMKAEPRIVYNPVKSYIIIGGLGGMGLELIFWMLKNGARKFVVTTRKGVKNPYQEYRLRSLKAEGATIEVLVNSGCTRSDVISIIKHATVMAPVDGIFNLALDLNDCLIENQTVETMRTACESKADTTLHLSQVSEELCPDLEHFVCFSSAVSVRGNAGQSNYAYANGVMEMICEKRRRKGLPGVAIQWGAIGDVGFVVDKYGTNDLAIAGSLPQRIPSVMSHLKMIMASPYPVVASYVIESNRKTVANERTDLVKTVLHVLGINDASTIDETTTIGDLGMDSLMAVEIKQRVERDYLISLTPQEIRNLTIKNLKEINKKRISAGSSSSSAADSKKESSQTYNVFEAPKKFFVRLDENHQGAPIFFVPPLDGDFSLIVPMRKQITRPIVGINWLPELSSCKTMEEVASVLVQKLREEYPMPQYQFVGYSFGVCIAFAMAVRLQKEFGVATVEKIVALDGSPEYLKLRTSQVMQKTSAQDEETAFTEAICLLASSVLKTEDLMELRNELVQTKSTSGKAQVASELISTRSTTACQASCITETAIMFVSKLRMLHFYEPKEKFVGKVTLIKATDESEIAAGKWESDYGFKKITDGDVNVIEKQGDHKTFLSSNCDEIGEFIDKHLYFING